jgi:hypothetical protein
LRRKSGKSQWPLKAYYRLQKLRLLLPLRPLNLQRYLPRKLLLLPNLNW